MQNPPQGPQGPMYPPQPTQPRPYVPSQPTYPPQPVQPPTPYPPQYPMYQPAPPMMPQQMTVYFQNQSFTGKAVAAFALYWLGYIPGLIFNIMFLNEAENVKKDTGRTPAGYGCLWATLIGSLLPALLFIGLCVIIFAGVLAAGGGSSTP